MWGSAGTGMNGAFLMYASRMLADDMTLLCSGPPDLQECLNDNGKIHKS